MTQEEEKKAEETGPHDPAPQSALKKFFRAVWWRLQWLLPNRVPSPYRDAAYRRAHDIEANSETRVPEDEELRLRAVWGTELFGPNESDRLYAALKALNWSAGYGGSNNEALVWVQQQRTYGRGGTYNIGVVVRRADRSKYALPANFAPLPDEVDYLLVRLHQVVPSVTCMVVCFVLRQEASTRYERELNLDRVSIRERGDRWSIRELDPTHIKGRAVTRVRAELSEMVNEWFRQHVSGYFAQMNRPERFPTAELVTTKTHDLFAEPGAEAFFNWRRLMVNVGHSDVWTSHDLPCFRFMHESSVWPREEGFHLIANLTTSALPSERVRHYGSDYRAAVAICHERIEGILSYGAVVAYLLEAASDLKTTRETLKPTKSKQQTLGVIEHIETFFDQGVGIPATARELAKDSKHSGSFRHYCDDFTAPAWDKNDADRHFADELRNRVHFLASELITEETSTREQFEQLSTIMSIRESIRAQRRMEWLTVAALVVAFASLVVALR